MINATLCPEFLISDLFEYIPELIEAFGAILLTLDIFLKVTLKHTKGWHLKGIIQSVQLSSSLKEQVR